MSAVLAGGGLAAWGLGTGMDLIGQYQGTRAMSREAAKQNAEQRRFMANRRGQIGSEIERRGASPGGMQLTAGATDTAQRSLNAINPSAIAGGKALGVTADPQIAQAYPNITLGGYSNAAAVQGARDNAAMRTLGINLGVMDEENRRQTSLYNQRMQNAGMHGGGWRTMGQLFQQYGLGAAMMGMSMGPDAAPAGQPTPQTMGEQGFANMDADPNLYDPMGAGGDMQTNLNVQRYLAGQRY